jgi:hypothetical protein
MVVIERKRIFLFQPKTNIAQENAAEYSAIMNIPHGAENIRKMSISVWKTN